jgi:hypothetical protein
MSSTGVKGSTQTNKSPRKGSNKRAKDNPKGSPGLAHRTVRCTREPNSKLATFGNLGGRSAVIHRTVQCSTGLSGAPSGVTTIPHQRSFATLQCATARAEVKAGAEGAPDSEQDLSGAPPDCPVTQLSEAPTVGTQRLGDVAGAPDSVRWRPGLSGAPYDRSLHQRSTWGLGL